MFGDFCGLPSSHNLRLHLDLEDPNSRVDCPSLSRLNYHIVTTSVGVNAGPHGHTARESRM